MTSELKCPFCNGELVGTIGHPICRNQDCVMCDDPMPQDLLEELIRTRKALDVAKYAIKNIKNDMKKVKDGDDMWEIQKNLHDYCKTTIKKITALLQKDVK